MIQVDNEKALRDALVSCSGDIELTRSFPVSEPIVITGRAQIRGAGLSANSCEGAVVLFRAPAFFDIMVSVEGGDAVFKNLVIDGTFQSDRNSGKDIEAIFYLSAGSLTLDESVRLKNRARENHRDENFSASPAGSSSNTCMPQFSDNIHVKSFRSAAREDGIFGSPPADLSGKISVQPPPLLSTEPSEKIPHLLLLPENTSSAPVRPFPSMAETTFTKGFRITFRGGCDHTFPAARFLPHPVMSDEHASAAIPLQIPVKRGYRFSGWQTGDKKIYQPGEIITGITANLMLTAVWESVQ